MTFDWQQFLASRGIDHVPGTRNNVEVACPFCGRSDAGHHHMSISLEGMGWRCWRNNDHHGRSPVGLIRALIGCSLDEARRIAGVRPAVASAGLGALVRGMLEPQGGLGAPTALPEPPEFRKLSDRPSARPFMRYLEGRGFDRDFLLRHGDALGLRYAVRGPFGGRIIFLVHDGGALVTWTGRTLSTRQGLRYKELPVNPESADAIGLPPASVPLHSCLLWQDDLARTRAPVLCMVEGPMDALKLRMLGRRVIQPSAMFTNSLSGAQIDRLRTIVSRFESRVLLLDRGAEGRAITARQSLAALGFKVRWLPEGVDDPGELSSRTFAKLALDSVPELRQ